MKHQSPDLVAEKDERFHFPTQEDGKEKEEGQKVFSGGGRPFT